MVLSLLFCSWLSDSERALPDGVSWPSLLINGALGSAFSLLVSFVPLRNMAINLLKKPMIAFKVLLILISFNV